jgi:hypothetical protein
MVDQGSGAVDDPGLSPAAFALPADVQPPERERHGIEPVIPDEVSRLARSDAEIHYSAFHMCIPWEAPMPRNVCVRDNCQDVLERQAARRVFRRLK